MLHWRASSSKSRTRNVSASAILLCVSIASPANGSVTEPSGSGRPEVTICDFGGADVVKRLRSELALINVRVRVSSKESCRNERPTSQHIIVVVAPDRVSIRHARAEGDEELDVNPNPEESPELVALSTVELLRARLLHLPSDEPDVESTSSKSSTPAAVGFAARRSSVELGPSLFVPSNPFPMIVGIYGQVNHELGHGFVFGLRGSASLNRAEFPVDGGKLEYALHTVAVLAQYRLPFFEGLVEARPTVGVGFALGSSKAIPDSKNFLDTASQRWSSIGFVSMEVGLTPMRHWSFVTSGGITALSPNMIFDGARRDPAVGGANSPERKHELGRFGAMLSAGVRFGW